MTDTFAELPTYPTPRTCPFDPPAAPTGEGAVAPPTRVRLWTGGVGWLVTRHSDARAVLGDPRFSVEMTGSDQTIAAARLALSFLTMDNPQHAVLRGALAGEFTIKRVETLRPRVQRIVDDLLDELVSEGAPADLVERLALPVPSLVICELLGVPYSDHEFFQANSRVIVDPDTTEQELTTAMGNLTGYLSDLLAAKRRDPGDDLLTRLVTTYVRRGEVSMSEAANMSRFLLTAGHETTANMISLGILALLENPEQLAAFREARDPDVIRNAVDELLRYLSVLTQGVIRTALSDVTIGGEVVRAGEAVSVAFNAANRDPASFPGNHDELDIRRDARQHLAFGFGIHHCLGRPLAILELEVVYPTLFRRLPNLSLDTSLDQIPFKNATTIYGLRGLPVTW